MSALDFLGHPRRHQCSTAGAALRIARRAKERTYPEMLGSPRCRLVVLAVELGGRFSQEAAQFLRLLARSRPGSSSATPSSSGCCLHAPMVCPPCRQPRDPRQPACAANTSLALPTSMARPQPSVMSSLGTATQGHPALQAAFPCRGERRQCGVWVFIADDFSVLGLSCAWPSAYAQGPRKTWVQKGAWGKNLLVILIPVHRSYPSSSWCSWSCFA